MPNSSLMCAEEISSQRPPGAIQKKRRKSLHSTSGSRAGRRNTVPELITVTVLLFQYAPVFWVSRPSAPAPVFVNFLFAFAYL